MNDNIFVLSALVKKSGNTDSNIVAFISVMLMLGVITSIITSSDIQHLIKRKKYLCGWLIVISYNIVMAAIPSLVVCLTFILSIELAVTKNKHAVEPLSIIYAILMAAALIVFPTVSAVMTDAAVSNPETIKVNGVTYTLSDDGKYYATEYDGENSLIVIPTIIEDKYQVGGLSEEFNKGGSSYIFDLNFEYATKSNQILKVIATTLTTNEKFPVPQREGYTFYGWWSTNNRNTGRQIVSQDGEITGANISKEQKLYAMWYGSDYTFIASARDFSISNYGKYVLTADIDLGKNYTPIGGLSGMETQSSRSPFSCVLDGNFHTIKYSISGSRRYNGLFSWIGSQGMVKNLSVNVNINVEFKPTSTQYFAFAGGIAAINDGTIKNCWSEGSIYLKSTTSVAEAGGIVGASGTDNLRTGEIRDCYNVATIETVADDAYAGAF